jgi:hypothetical protein
MNIKRKDLQKSIPYFIDSKERDFGCLGRAKDEMDALRRKAGASPRTPSEVFYRVRYTNR